MKGGGDKRVIFGYTLLTGRCPGRHKVGADGFGRLPPLFSGREGRGWAGRGRGLWPGGVARGGPVGVPTAPPTLTAAHRHHLQFCLHQRLAQGSEVLCGQSNWSIT